MRDRRNSHAVPLNLVPAGRDSRKRFHAGYHVHRVEHGQVALPESVRIAGTGPDRAVRRAGKPEIEHYRHGHARRAPAALTLCDVNITIALGTAAYFTRKNKTLSESRISTAKQRQMKMGASNRRQSSGCARSRKRMMRPTMSPRISRPTGAARIPKFSIISPLTP